VTGRLYPAIGIDARNEGATLIAQFHQTPSNPFVYQPEALVNSNTEVAETKSQGGNEEVERSDDSDDY